MTGDSGLLLPWQALLRALRLMACLPFLRLRRRQGFAVQRLLVLLLVQGCWALVVPGWHWAWLPAGSPLGSGHASCHAGQSPGGWPALHPSSACTYAHTPVLAISPFNATVHTCASTQSVGLAWDSECVKNAERNALDISGHQCTWLTAGGACKTALVPGSVFPYLLLARLPVLRSIGRLSFCAKAALKRGASGV